MTHILLAIKWSEVFPPTVPVLETLVRGSVVYLGLIFLLRVVLKREGGTLSLSDVLMVVLLGDASQNAMASNHKSISDGMLLVCTILFWNYALDYLGYRFPRFERLLHPAPLCLVRNGQMLRRNMRKELVSEDELMSQIRKQGLEDLSKVKHAFIEGDGHISVITRDEQPKAKQTAEDRPL